MVTVVLEDDGVNLPRMRKTNNSNIQENYIQKLRKLRVKQLVLSVCQFVCQSSEK